MALKNTLKGKTIMPITIGLSWASESLGDKAEEI